MSQSDLFGCDDFVLRYDDGAESAPSFPENDTEQLCFQWEADTGLPGRQMPLLDQGMVPFALYPVLSHLPGQKPWEWAARIAGRPLKKWESRRLLACQGLESHAIERDKRYKDIRTATLAKGRRIRRRNLNRRIGRYEKPGRNEHNQAAKAERQRKWYAVRGYIYVSLVRGWRKDPIDPALLFEMACEKYFGTGAPYANRGKLAAFRAWAIAGAMALLAGEARTAHKPVTYPPRDPSNYTVEPNGSPYENKYPLTSPGLPDRPPGCSPPRGGCAKVASPTSPEPSRSDARGPTAPPLGAGTCPDGGLFPSEGTGLPPKLVGVAKAALPRLAASHWDTCRVSWDARQASWCVGWLAHWLAQGRALPALVKAYGRAVARWHAIGTDAGFGPGCFGPGGLRGQCQTAAAGLPAFPSEFFLCNSGHRPRIQKADTATVQDWADYHAALDPLAAEVAARRDAEAAAQAAAVEKQQAAIRARLATEKDPAIREILTKQFYRLSRPA